MSATMARQGGRLQLEQSNMRLALNMAKMADEGFSRATIEEMKQLIKKPLAEVREENKQGVVFPEHNKMKAMIEKQPGMIRENQMDGCFPWQNGTAKNPQTRWRRKSTGAPQPRPAPPMPGTPPAPPAPPDVSERTQCSETECVPPGYVFIPTPPPSARDIIHDPYAKDQLHDNDFIPDLPTDEGSSTG